MGEGGDLLIKRPGPVKIPGCHSGGHGFRVQLQRAGGIAVGRLLMDAQMLSGFQLFLGEHPLLAVNMGGGPFFNDHVHHSLGWNVFYWDGYLCKSRI